MVVVDGPNTKPLSHYAVIKDGKLICFQCNRVAAKEADFQRLPLKTKIFKKIDEYTKIITLFKRTKKRVNKFIYFKFGKGKS
jgi:hypothetical protein